MTKWNQVIKLLNSQKPLKKIGKHKEKHKLEKKEVLSTVLKQIRRENPC